MKQTRLALLLATTFLAAPALAASVTMLQFGSFETRDEAQKRLTEVNAKYGTVIGGLPATIREVKLPPDNLTVYRTQAGPVENRAAAQSICAKLASAGDECYIVQTAMVEGAAPVAAEAKPAANTTPSLLPEPIKPVTADAPDLTSKLSSLQEVPARDPSSRARLSSVNGAMTEPTASSSMSVTADAPIAAEPSPQLQAALDNAIANQEASAANINKATTETAPKRGFWSQMNPFSDDDSAPSAPAAKVPAPIVEAAPVEPQPEALVVPPEMPKAAPIIVAAEPAPMAINATPVITQPEPMLLPPPPAPLKAQNHAMSDVAKVDAPIAIGNLPPLSPGPAPQPIPAKGVVNVEEAKRVPVTEMAQPPLPFATPAIMSKQAPSLQPPVSLRPSATDGQKTIWAQIGPFADSAAALNFWTNYRQSNPDFPVVRVRVTTPYQQAQGTNQSWLRVGPVSRAGFITGLCGSIAPESKLRCGHVVDLGVASSVKRPGLLPISRYSR